VGAGLGEGARTISIPGWHPTWSPATDIGADAWWDVVFFVVVAARGYTPERHRLRIEDGDAPRIDVLLEHRTP